METMIMTKDQKVDLTKLQPGLTKVTAGLGWDVNRGSSGTFDLDAFAFFVRESKAQSGNTNLCYFRNKDGVPGVKLSGDNLTGAGDGDDESLYIDFAAVPADVEAIVIGVNIYDAASKRQNFSMINNSFVRIYDASNPATVFIKYDLNEDYGTSTGIIMGYLYRHNGEWKFKAIGKGVNGDINAILAAYVHAA